MMSSAAERNGELRNNLGKDGSRLYYLKPGLLVPGEFSGGAQTPRTPSCPAGTGSCILDALFITPTSPLSQNFGEFLFSNDSAVVLFLFLIANQLHPASALMCPMDR